MHFKICYTKLNVRLHEIGPEGPMIHSLYCKSVKVIRKKKRLRILFSMYIFLLILSIIVYSTPGKKED